MPRFQLAQYIGENLTPEEIKELKLKDPETKIKDSTGELPDLVITDPVVAREYIDYMNRPVQEEKIAQLIIDIRNNIDSINKLNSTLIKPEEVIFGEDEDGNPLSYTPLKEELFIMGYRTRIQNETSSINRKLTQLKEYLTEK